MAYLALYRRFRPQIFEDLIGQEAVVKTLVNQIKTDKIGHAYLFCGARGTGKTTAAKIFARAINCLNPINGSPCGECEVCKKLADKNNLDVLEIDAASNNKVDNVREIRDKVQYPPVSGKYKVYIIDEVHMLTTEAFNALLKTLEEPPKHAVFILATTEPHKLPATILSRCMRFDFKLVSEEKLKELIKKIYNEIGKEYEEESISAIARAGEGSVRDALSVADTCVSYNEGKLTYADVTEVLGSSNVKKTEELVDNIFSGSTGGALSVVDELCSLGKSVGMLTKDILTFLRNVMVVKTCTDYAKILSIPKEGLTSLKQIADKKDAHGILRTIEVFSNVENELKYSTHPRIIFEAAVVKSTFPQDDYNIDALMSRIAKLEKMFESGVVSKNNTVSQRENIQSEKPIAQTEMENKAPDFDSFEKKPKDSVETLEREDRKKLSWAEIEKSVINNEVENESFNKKENPLTNTEKTIKNEQRVVEKTSSQNSMIEDKPTIPDKHLFGMFIRELRNTKNISLWTLCNDLSGVVVDKTLNIVAENNEIFSTLNKDDVFNRMKEVLSHISKYDLKIARNVENATNNKESGFNEDLKKINDNFGNVEVKD